MTAPTLMVSGAGGGASVGASVAAASAGGLVAGSSVVAPPAQPASTRPSTIDPRTNVLTRMFSSFWPDADSDPPQEAGPQRADRLPLAAMRTPGFSPNPRVGANPPEAHPGRAKPPGRTTSPRSADPYPPPPPPPHLSPEQRTAPPESVRPACRCRRRTRQSERRTSKRR